MKRFTPDELDLHEVDDIVSTIAGVTPDFWSEDTIRRVIVAGANRMLDNRDSGEDKGENRE
jgi:hypothetical protein